MKFLCIECDEAMKLSETRGPDDGSMTVIFGCPNCGKSVAMLTNAMETQMVRSLGVKVGGRTVPAEPMETVRAALNPDFANIPEPEAQTDPVEIPAESQSSEAKCPFSGAVSEAFSKTENQMKWTDAAEERLQRIPDFIRPMVRKSIEQHAIEKGISEITATVMDEMKDLVGMRYS